MKAKINDLLATIRKLYELIPRKHKFYWGLLILSSSGLSLMEALSVATIVPFIAIATNPELLDSGPFGIAFRLSGIQDPDVFIRLFGMAIAAFYVIRALFRLTNAYFSGRVSEVMARYFSTKLFAITLSLPYTAYVKKNPGVLIGIVNGEANAVSGVFMAIMNMFIDLLTIVVLYALLLLVNWQMTLAFTLIIAAIAIAFLKILVPINAVFGAKSVEAGRKTFRILQEALRNFKFIKLKGNRDELVGNYGSERLKSARMGIKAGILNSIPKEMLETVGFLLLIVAVLVILSSGDDAAMVIPLLSTFALSLYRILPAINRVLNKINDFAFMQHSLDTIKGMLQEPIEGEGDEPVNFSEELGLRGVSFAYATGGEVIHDVSLSIRKGERVAFTGESGGGKTTLIDLLIGVLKPCSGEVAVDGRPLCEDNIRAWRRKIGYIPQSIYLFDATIWENVAYGAERDDERIKLVLQKANIWDFLQTKDGLNTIVGDGGVQLSGGQQQRVGIARALYNDPEVLVLDEATSALDNETEGKIMDEIYDASQDKTLIVIAHRLSTIERCDRVIRIEGGRIAGVVESRNGRARLTTHR